MLKNYSNKSKRHQTEEVKPARSIELKQAAQRQRHRERERERERFMLQMSLHLMYRLESYEI